MFRNQHMTEWMNRRSFLRSLGITGGVVLLGGSAGCTQILYPGLETEKDAEVERLLRIQFTTQFVSRDGGAGVVQILADGELLVEVPLDLSEIQMMEAQGKRFQELVEPVSTSVTLLAVLKAIAVAAAKLKAAAIAVGKACAAWKLTKIANDFTVAFLDSLAECLQLQDRQGLHTKVANVVATLTGLVNAVCNLDLKALVELILGIRLNLVDIVRSHVVQIACTPRPPLYIDGGTSSRRRQGETFTIWGTGYSPNGQVILRLRIISQPPSRVPVQEVPLKANSAGSINYSLRTTCSFPPGSYSFEAQDVATGKVSDRVIATVERGANCR